MKEARRSSMNGLPIIEAEVGVDGNKKWRRLYCPLSHSTEGDPCGPWCAWYTEEDADGGYPYRHRVMVRCKDHVIATINNQPKKDKE